MCSQFLRHKFAGFYPIVLCGCDFAEEEKLFATLDEFFLEGPRNYRICQTGQ